MQSQTIRLISRHINGLTLALYGSFLQVIIHWMRVLCSRKDFLNSLINCVLIRTNKKRQKFPAHYCCVIFMFLTDIFVYFYIILYLFQCIHIYFHFLLISLFLCIIFTSEDYLFSWQLYKLIMLPLHNYNNKTILHNYNYFLGW